MIRNLYPNLIFVPNKNYADSNGAALALIQVLEKPTDCAWAPVGLGLLGSGRTIEIPIFKVVLPLVNTKCTAK